MSKNIQFVNPETGSFNTAAMPENYQTRLTAYALAPDRGEAVKGLKPEEVVGLVAVAAFCINAAPEQSPEGWKMAHDEMVEKKQGDPALLDRLQMQEWKFVKDVKSAAASLQAEANVTEALVNHYSYPAELIEATVKTLKEKGGAGNKKGLGLASAHAQNLFGDDAAAKEAAEAYFTEKGITSQTVVVGGIEMEVEGGAPEASTAKIVEKPAEPVAPVAPNPVSEVAGEQVNTAAVPMEGSVIGALMGLLQTSLNAQAASADDNESFGTVMMEVGKQMSAKAKHQKASVEQQLTMLVELRASLNLPAAAPVAPALEAAAA